MISNQQKRMRKVEKEKGKHKIDPFNNSTPVELSEWVQSSQMFYDYSVMFSYIFDISIDILYKYKYSAVCRVPKATHEKL